MHRSRLSTFSLMLTPRMPRIPRVSGPRPWRARAGSTGRSAVHLFARRHPGSRTSGSGHRGHPRYHLDIETDNVTAETARLIQLGAVEVSRWLECRTLRAPGGQLICVIPRHSADATFDRLAHTWP